jgi:hypothetical protein
MSTDTDDPPSTEITLTYEDEHWIARDVKTGTVREGQSRMEALRALDEAIAGTPDAASINPDDPFWEAEPAASGGPTDLSERVDEYLYGDESGDT